MSSLLSVVFADGDAYEIFDVVVVVVVVGIAVVADCHMVWSWLVMINCC